MTIEQDLNSYWCKIPIDYMGEHPREIYKGFYIGLAIPNGGIVGVDIWNEQGTCEYLCTEDFDKYSDLEWHMKEAKKRIDYLVELEVQNE